MFFFLTEKKVLLTNRDWNNGSHSIASVKWWKKWNEWLQRILIQRYGKDLNLMMKLKNMDVVLAGHEFVENDWREAHTPSMYVFSLTAGGLLIRCKCYVEKKREGEANKTKQWKHFGSWLPHSSSYIAHSHVYFLFRGPNFINTDSKMERSPERRWTPEK